jgi:UrcA family protein
MKNSIKLALASAVAFGFMAAAPAAADEFERESQRIVYDDLNLDSQRGAYVMLGRIEYAAEVVCGDRAGPMTLAEHFAIQDCLESKMEGAVTEVNNANVTSLYYGRRPNITITGR